MYPLEPGPLWASQQWYVAGYSSDFGDAPIERTLLGQRILFYRSTSGEAVALAGLCPHRFMPLVNGARSGDVIECPYHGMAFDATGHCTIGPAGAAAPGATALRRYAVIEQPPLVWIWGGAYEDADPAKLPAMSEFGFDQPGWRTDQSCYVHVAARYMLVVDNLFDLSHIDWVHSSIMGKMTICQQPLKVSKAAGRLRSERREVGPVGDFFRLFFPDVQGPLEHELATEMLSPGMIAGIGPSASEGEESPRAGERLGTVHFMHAITPETAHSTHIFMTIIRNFRTDDHGLSAILGEQNKAVLSQDREIAEQVEIALAHADTDREMSFRSDRGGVEARRAIQSLINAERPPPPAARAA